MKIYAISGLGADERVFQYLRLTHPLIPIAWIEPSKNESIESYALRLAKKIDTDEKFAILGVSFGGLIAVEISKQLNPEWTILISTVEIKSDLRWIYRLIGKTHIIKLIPTKLFRPPKIPIYWLFGVNNKNLLSDILEDTDLKFTKWALNVLMTWENTERLKNQILKISGKKDKLMPPSERENEILLKKGKHFMIVDEANTISEVINRKVEG